jgi:exosome complex component RRP42
MLSLSQGEIDFIAEGIQQDIRVDGRGRLDYRPFSIETGIISQANGSARWVKFSQLLTLRVVLEGTDVLVGVKAELEQPSLSRPNEGRVEVSVEW